MAEYIPPFESPAFTLQATGTIVGGQVVTAAGTTAGAAATTMVGVAGFDAVAGDNVTVWYGNIQRPVAAANITAGALVKCAANGQVTPYVVGTDAIDQLVGRALKAASSGAPVLVRFFNV